MERLSAPERTREELRALMNGNLGTAEGRGDLVRLALRLIVEEALEGEVSDAIGRERYQRGEGEKAGYRRYHDVPNGGQAALFGITHMDQVQSTNESIVTVLAAIELSKTTWLLAIHDPTSNKVSRRRSDGGDVED